MIGYGVVDAGIVAVGNEMLNVPLLLPIACVTLFPLMVIDTVSVAGGNTDPAAIVPVTVIVGVPYVTLYDAFRLLNVGAAVFTLSLIHIY